MNNKRVLFSLDQVFELAKAYQKHMEGTDMDDYSQGIVDGIEFVLFLRERME